MLFSSLRLSKRIPSKLIYNKKYSALNVFKYFKELGLDPSSKDKYSQTCLYYTCREGKILCSRYLIDECHLRVNEIDLYGQKEYHFLTLIDFSLYIKPSEYSRYYTNLSRLLKLKQ